MNFYIIYNNDFQGENDMLERLVEEARKLSLTPVPVEVHTCIAPKIEDQDKNLIYRIETGEVARNIEKLYTTSNSTNFYVNTFDCLRDQASVISRISIYKNSKIPYPPTYFINSNDRTQLTQIADELEFPLILKVTEGSHGNGIIKIDSLQTLFSISDYLLSEKRVFVLRKYIKNNSHARLIVLGNKVISSIEYIAPKGEFRTNVGENPIVKARKFNTLFEETAIKAVSAIGLDFGGVDILFENENTPYIAEVNFPCYFVRCEKAAGDNIAKQMAEYLISKSSRLDEK